MVISDMFLIKFLTKFIKYILNCDRQLQGTF